MSYCRWSSDNFKSDVYCYAHVDGTWTTHVAGSRYAAWPDDVTLVPITLPHAGETFKDDGPASMRDRLLWLRSLGYIVPQFAIESLAEEATEG